MSAPDQSRVRRLLGNASKLVVADAAASAIGFLQAIVIGRVLGAGGYGLLSIAIAFATLFNQLVDVRLWETAIKFVGEYHERRQHDHARAVIRLVYLIDAGTGLLAFVLAVLVAPLAATTLFHRPEAAGLIIVYSLTLLVSTVNLTSMALLRVFDRFTLLGVERAVATGVRAAALIGVAVATRSLMALMWTYVVVDLLRATVLLVLGLRTAARELDATGPAPLSLLRPRLRELVGFSIHNWLTSVLALVTREVDVLILAAFRGDREVGFYRMAKNFSRLLVHVYDPIYQAIYPELVRLREQVEDMREVWRFIARTMRWVLAVFVPLTIMIVLGAPIILRMSVGNEFLPAAPAVRIMVTGVLVNAALVWARPLALTAGRPDVSTLAFACSALILAVASVVLVPRFGYMGSAVTYLITMSSVAILSAVGATRAAAKAPPGGSRQ